MKKITKKLLALILCVLSISFVGCGASSGSSSGSGSKKILVVTNELDTFRQALVDAALEAGEAKGYTMDLKTATTADEQVQIIADAKGGGYGGILCIPCDSNTALQLEITAGDLPIVFTNSMPSDTYLKPGKYVYCGSSERDAGNFQAQFVLDKLGNKDELNVIILKGEKGHSGTNGRTGAVKDALRASGKNFNIVFEDYGYWDTEKAKNMFLTFNKTGNPVDAVFCNNDNMAIGVIDACKELGIDPKSILICGVDATADGCKAIADGTMAYTVCQNAKGQGITCIDALDAVTKGKDLSEATLSDPNEVVTADGLHLYYPFEPVTKDNVADYQ